MSDYRADLPGTPERAASEAEVEAMRARGGIFVEAVRATRVPMLVTDATLPGNPVIFANAAFLAASGYAMPEVLGRDPHFLDGADTDPETVRRFATAIQEGRNETLEILQYRKDGTRWWAALFVGPWRDDRGQIIHHFLSFLDITRRCDAEAALRRLADDLERRVADRTAALTAANAQLTRLLAERETLLVEVNHRAKNSLMSASALLTIQAQQQADPGVKAVLHEAEARLHAMARVHDLLSAARDPQRIALAGYLNNLCASLLPLTGEAHIRCVVDAEDRIHLDADRAVALGLVVNELVTNAVKHAFPPSRPGMIEVRARRVGPERVRLCVRDDGIGMTAPREGSLGYGLVRALVGQMGGELAVGQDGGVAVTVEFPG